METPERTIFEKELNARVSFLETTVVVDLANCMMDLKSICMQQQNQIEELKKVGVQHQIAIEEIVRLRFENISLN